jgi:hypothetical protein
LTRRKKVEKVPDETLIEKTHTLLEANRVMMESLMERPAMNGGFDALMGKIEAIHEDLRNHIIEDDKRAETIYKPDIGLFARVKAIEDLGLAAIMVRDDVTKLKIWHDVEEKNAAKEEELDEVQHTKLAEHDVNINDLNKSRDRIVGMGKWVLAIVAGGILSLIGKALLKLL